MVEVEEVEILQQIHLDLLLVHIQFVCELKNSWTALSSRMFEEEWEEEDHL